MPAHRLTRTGVLVLSLLLLALPLHGLAGLLANVLGSSHQHQRASAAAQGFDGWRDFRRSTEAAPAMHAPHGHSFWQRHRHSRADASVVALDGGAQGTSPSTDGTSSAAAAATLCPPGRSVIDIGAADESRSAWPGPRAWRMSSTVTTPLERPPKA